MSNRGHPRRYYQEEQRKHKAKRIEREQAKEQKRLHKRARERERRNRKVTAEYGEEAYNACGRKVRYENKEQAELFIRRHSFENPLSVYWCRYCHGWHCTSHPREDDPEME